jgi:hypothetical protein
MEQIQGEILAKLAKLEGLEGYRVDKVDLVINKNLHEGKDTFACKFMLTPESKFNEIFVKTIEGHDYLGIIKELANEAVEFVLRQKEKNS